MYLLSLFINKMEGFNHKNDKRLPVSRIPMWTDQEQGIWKNRDQKLDFPPNIPYFVYLILEPSKFFSKL